MFIDRQWLLTFSILLLGLAILSISDSVEGVSSRPEEPSREEEPPPEEAPSPEVTDDLMDELQKKLDDLEDN